MPRDHAHGVAFHPDKIVKVDGQQERQNRIGVHYRKDLAFRADAPVLVLDASGDAEIYRRLLGDRLTAAMAVQCERNVEVVQVKDATLPRSSLLGTDRRGNALSDTSPALAERLRAEMVAAANALAAKHGGAFMLATNMAVETAVTAELAEVGVTDAVLTGHFGKMRGRNDYEHCTAGMVLGRNQPPPSAMEAMARAIWANDPEPLALSRTYEKANRGIRMRDGSAVPVEVDVHPDPRVQRVLELHRERESEQAADRLRLIHNADRKVLYVACNLPLNLTVDRVVTRRALVHEATGRVDNGQEGKGRRIYGNRLVEAYRISGGVLPLSRAELVRLSADETSVFRGLWLSERVVRDDLAKMAVSAIRTLLAETAIFPPALVTYRLEGQRCPSRALVSPEIPDGRAALQALLGKPIVAYEVEDGPEPPDAPRPPPPAAPASEPAAPNDTEVSMPHPLDELGAAPGPLDVQMLAQGGVALADAADAARCFPHLWPSPAAARQAFHRARCVTKPLGETTGGECHAPLRRATYQRAGAGKRPAALVFDPAVVPPEELRAWLEERVGPLARLEDEPPRDPPPPEPPERPQTPADGPPAAIAAPNGSASPQVAPGGTVGPKSEPPPPAAAPAPSAALREAMAVRVHQQRRRLAALVQRLEESRPRRTHAMRQLDRQAYQDAAREAAGLPSDAWWPWRSTFGTAAAGWPPRPPAPPPVVEAHR